MCELSVLFSDGWFIFYIRYANVAILLIYYIDFTLKFLYIIGKVSSVFYMVSGTAFGRALQLIKLTALYSIYDQNQLNLI